MNKKFFNKRSTLYALRSTTPRNRGAALTLAVLFFVIISLAIVMGSVNPIVRDFNAGSELINSKLSYFTAEAGNEDGIYRLKSGKQISNPEVTMLNGGSVSVTTANISNDQKQVTADANISSNQRNVDTVLFTGVGSDFVYGAQVGEGGLVMANNSRVEGTGGVAGNVYSNGPISGGSGTAITGSATVATSVSEDNQARSEVCNADQIMAQANPEIDFAESFSPGATLPLYKISLYIKKVVAPSTDNPPATTIRIVADNGSGVPNTTTLASASLQSSLVSASYGWVDVTFTSPANLVGGQTYWIVLDTSLDSGGDDYWVWCRDSNNGFGNGVAKYRQTWNSGSAWSSAITGDLAFKTYVGAGPGIISGVAVNIDAYANTVNNSTVTGNLYCQTGSGNNKVCDTSQPDPGPLNLPISDGNIAQWKSDAADGGIITGNCGDGGVAGCNVPSGGSLSLGPKKIVGDLTLTNNRTLNLTGVLYITGTVSISNNATIKCDVSFGADSCVLLTDRSIDVSNNGVVNGSGQSGSYMLLVSTIEGCNGSGGTGCASGSSGINIGNNVTGGIFFTSKSMINLSNNATIKSIVGYKLNIANNAIVRYEQGVANTNFSSGPSGGWNVKSWNEVE